MVSSSKGELASDADNSSGDAPEAKSKSLFSQGEKLVKLRRSPNVDDILTKYLEHKSKKDGMDPNARNIVGTPNFAHENHAIKKQTPDGGKSKQILTVNKPSNLPHKTRTRIVSSSSSFCPASAKSAFKEDKKDRKMHVREPAAAPFVSMAEMIKKFQSGIREMSLPSNNCSLYQSNAGEAMHRKSKLALTTPKTPEFETSQRVRSVKIKTSAEIEEEMMSRIPKFKARPLNRKIFEASTLPPLPRSIPHPTKFKLSCSESLREKPFPRNTTPNPFHLHTEERGAEKERRVAKELMQKQYEEERARVPRAHPYPYTTDYLVFPPKPEPKPCTRPEPFQLESLLRPEQEMQRKMEEMRRMEMEEVEMRKFKALPILQEDPIPLPEKERRPLTEVQEFNLLVKNRAVERSKFDMKIKKKEMAYQRYREETEAAKMMEEEKALKQLRRTLVHHARPVPRFDHPFLPQK